MRINKIQKKVAISVIDRRIDALKHAERKQILFTRRGSIGNGPINLRSEREKEKKKERITILKHVHGKTVAVKLGNYRSHGNHKRSLFARNLSNPLPPTSLFHGNLARGRGREGGRKGISIEEPRHKERVEGKGQVSR